MVEQNQHLDEYPDNLSGIRGMLGYFVPPEPITWTGSPLVFPAFEETVTVDADGKLVGTPIVSYKECPVSTELNLKTNTCQGCTEGYEYVEEVSGRSLSVF